MVDILEVDVVICGAGLGGLAAAQGLINSGFSVMSFEKNSGFQPRGAALGISPNGLKALELLVPGLGKMIFDKGTRVSTASTEEVFPNQGRMFAWAHVRSLLLPSNLDLRMGSEFVDFEEKGDFIYSRFNCKKNGKEDEILNVRSRVLCGADGIHSAVSKHLNGRKAIPTGAVNWRCSIEASPDDIEGEVKVEMKGDRCFGIFNVANQKLCWAAVTQRDPNTVMESITRKSREEIKKEALEEFSDFSQKYLDLIARTNADHIYYGPLLVHDLPKAIDQGWGGTGRVALLGDSAHGIRPASGQGAAMAFEDAVILCRKLKEVKDLSVTEDTTKALLNYENERLIRVKRVSNNEANIVQKLYSVKMNSAGVAFKDQKSASDEPVKEEESKELYMEWLMAGV